MKSFIVLFCFCKLVLANPGLELMKYRTQCANDFFKSKQEHAKASLQPLDLEQFFVENSKEKFDKIVLLYFMDDFCFRPSQKVGSLLPTLKEIEKIATSFGYQFQGMQAQNELFKFNSRDELDEFMNVIFSDKSRAVNVNNTLRFLGRFYYIRFIR